jgi:hypothetical protein
MRVLQARATLSSHRPHTPNEIRSAVRVRSSALFFTCKTRKNRKSPMFASGALSAVDSIPKPRPSELACYKWLQGTAGGVGESSGIDWLADVPEFGRVPHRRKSFARVPRS